MQLINRRKSWRQILVEGGVKVSNWGRAKIPKGGNRSSIWSAMAVGSTGSSLCGGSAAPRQRAAPEQRAVPGQWVPPEQMAHQNQTDRGNSSSISSGSAVPGQTAKAHWFVCWWSPQQKDGADPQFVVMQQCQYKRRRHPQNQVSSGHQFWAGHHRLDNRRKWPQ